jgi:hypothetical protein
MPDLVPILLRITKAHTFENLKPKARSGSAHGWAGLFILVENVSLKGDSLEI